MANELAILFQKAESLRAEAPVLWGIVRGRGSTSRIALLIGWPFHLVDRELKKYVATGTLKKAHQGTYHLSEHSPRYEELKQMKELYLRIERKLLGQPEEDIDPNDFASANRSEARRARAAANKISNKQILTDVQVNTLKAVWDNFAEAEFRTIEFARAQGRTTSGYTRGYLDSLRKKGFIVVVTQDAIKGTTWQLTAAGVERARAL